jgi:hypothetical protein
MFEAKNILKRRPILMKFNKLFFSCYHPIDINSPIRLSSLLDNNFEIDEILEKSFNKPAHNSAQAQPEEGMRLCAKR